MDHERLARINSMPRRPTIFLFADVLGSMGGIETYLDALARRLADDRWPVRVTVCLNGPAPFLNDLEQTGVHVYRQPRVPGDRWQFRQRLLVRQSPGRSSQAIGYIACDSRCRKSTCRSFERSMPAAARSRRVGLWLPNSYPLRWVGSASISSGRYRETDVVVSVAECTKSQFREQYRLCRPGRRRTLSQHRVV